MLVVAVAVLYAGSDEGGGGATGVAVGEAEGCASGGCGRRQGFDFRARRWICVYVGQRQDTCVFRILCEKALDTFVNPRAVFTVIYFRSLRVYSLTLYSCTVQYYVVHSRQLYRGYGRFLSTPLLGPLPTAYAQAEDGGL